MFASNTSAANGAANYIEDVFSTYLYTGNSGTTTNSNNIDLSTKGGMVWGKCRSAASTSHWVYDTVRGSQKSLYPNSTGGQTVDSSTETGVSAFSTTGFTTKGVSDYWNLSGNTYTSWTFRKQPKFFDIVTFTTNASGGGSFTHALGSVPGFAIIKCTSAAESWLTYHRGLTSTSYAINLNSTGAQYNVGYDWLGLTSTSATIPNGTLTASQTYVAYLYAHNSGGFGLTGTDNVITCGSYTTTGNDTINLGYEPQFIIEKRASGASDWHMWDVMRGMSQTNLQELEANTSAAEATIGATGYVKPTATGYNNTYWSAGETVIYIAIRRGPMKVPTSGASVFSPLAVNNATGTANTTGFPVDLSIFKERTNASGDVWDFDRLRGVSSTTSESGASLKTNSTSVEGTTGLTRSWNNTGFQTNSSFNSVSMAYWCFRRAPGFFDEVCYTGTGANLTQNHNLGVAPELTIIKSRSDVAGWIVGTNFGASTFTYGVLQSTSAMSTQSYPLVYTAAPTSTQLSLGTTATVNTSGSTYVAYLFATCAGVSKVGSYTGNGSSQTINCNFTGGARFVLIKRTDSTGDWYVWDTARGIISANDPHLSLNTTAAEVTTDDTIDPDSTGFIVNQVTATNVNVSSATYIYLAIA